MNTKCARNWDDCLNCSGLQSHCLNQQVGHSQTHVSWVGLAQLRLEAFNAIKLYSTAKFHCRSRQWHLFLHPVVRGHIMDEKNLLLIWCAKLLLFEQRADDTCHQVQINHARKRPCPRSHWAFHAEVPLMLLQEQTKLHRPLDQSCSQSDQVQLVRQQSWQAIDVLCAPQLGCSACSHTLARCAKMT